MKDFILNRFKEDNSYIGIFLILGAFFGFDLTEAQQNAIMYFGMAMVAAPEGNLRRVFERVQSARNKRIVDGVSSDG